MSPLHNKDQNWRERAKNSLQNYFERRSYPRTMLTLLLLVTGLVAFFVSYALLRAGISHMWVRYPIAVVAGYGVLLAMVRLWVEVERTRFDPDDEAIAETAADRSRFVRDSSPDPELVLRSIDGSSSSWWDFADFLDFDEGFLPLLLLGSVVALVVALFSAVVAAPLLIAEVFLDAFLVTVLYRRLRIAQKEHWLGTALRRTWRLALVAAVALTVGGWALEQMAPGSRSMGKAIQQLTGRGSPAQ